MENRIKVAPGDIVKFNTECIWNGCSGEVTKIVKDIISVRLPGGLKLGFSLHEIEVCR